VEIGHSFAFEGGAACSTEPRYGAIVTQADRRNPVTGRPGSGCRPLLALHLTRDRRAANPPASRLPAGRNLQRSPLLGGFATALFSPVPSGLFRVGHVPDDRPYRRAGYVSLRVTFSWPLLPLRRCRYRRCRSAAVLSFLIVVGSIRPRTRARSSASARPTARAGDRQRASGHCDLA
jgi:hypothetical protein